MSSRRSKFEIYVDILTHIKSGVNISTRIMYASNLSWKPLCQILKSLIAQGLIEEHSVGEGNKRTKRIYSITEKGDTVLMYFNNAKNLMELGVSPLFNK